MLNTYNIQTGKLFDENGRNFDISVILNFPTKTDFDNCTGLDSFPSVNLIDFYFGTPNARDTESYLNAFIEKQSGLRRLVCKLLDLSTDENESEMAEYIELVKSFIVQLH